MLSDDKHITMVGVNRLQKLSIDLKYRGRITAIRRTENREQLADLYRKASVFVNPTLEEAFGLTNIESLACGTPVITYDTGGSPECIREGCGLVVPRGDIKGLKDAVDTLCNDSEDRTGLCNASVQRYDRNECYRQYISLYRSMVEQKSE